MSPSLASAILRPNTKAPLRLRSTCSSSADRFRIRVSDLDKITSEIASTRFGKSCLARLSEVDFQRAVFYTPPVREELTIKNSPVFPANFNAQHSYGLYSSPFLRESLRNVNPRYYDTTQVRTVRGFRTKASLAEENKSGALQFFLGSIGKKSNQSMNTEQINAMLKEGNLPVEEQNKLRIAFAEGYFAGGTKETTIYSFLKKMRSFVFLVITGYALWNLWQSRIIIRFSGVQMVSPGKVEVNFSDIKGIDESKADLEEVVEFLRNPEKFTELGGKLPNGVLLIGPPGTGKTLLARAVAGEANVPFFHASGSEFEEIYVGQGARRVRDLFSTAKLYAPCVIFIDEIDSVGSKRTVNKFQNTSQTINQLLSEMDGFTKNEGVIVIGATNRHNDLDEALIRPGRFDVHIHVPKPDLRGRKEILEYFLSKVKRSNDVSVDYLARATQGFTGAEIENMINQAAIRSAIDGQEYVNMSAIEKARDKHLMGSERKKRIPNEETNLITAYHEMGHALVNYYSSDPRPMHKITMMPRGDSLGHTSFLPHENEYHMTRAQMESWLDTLLGGRAAEELTFGTQKVTSGACSDFAKATDMATNMVRFWGMSDKVGVRTFPDARSFFSDGTTELIDREIERFLNESMERAKRVLKTHKDELSMLAQALLHYETLSADDFKKLLENGKLEP